MGNGGKGAGGAGGMGLLQAVIGIAASYGINIIGSARGFGLVDRECKHANCNLHNQ